MNNGEKWQESYSGCHPYRPQCAIAQVHADLADGPADLTARADEFALEAAVKISAALDEGMCPRCSGPLTDDPARLPAGSRMTDCRCIPVCAACGQSEPLVGRNWLTSWPLDEEWLQEERDLIAAFGPPVPVVLGPSGMVMVTEEGVTQAKSGPPSSGGWAQHGYDAEPDQKERMSE